MFKHVATPIPAVPGIHLSFRPCPRLLRAVSTGDPPPVASRWSRAARCGIATFEAIEASAPVAPDFRFTSHGTLCILDALTPAAQKWAEEHLPEDRTMWGTCGTVIEPRYAGDILEGIVNNGLTVA